MILFENEHNTLCEKISEVKTLIIDRIEYEREVSSQDNVYDIIKAIEEIKRDISIIRISEEEKATFKIDQSKALQDTINIAVATFDNKEFKAISGSNNVTNYCTEPPQNTASFKSCKVNKLDKLRIGYNRSFDSEKEILEEIHKQIEAKELKNEGNLILYSKWELCPSCYFVISQFCKYHPDIKVTLKYSKKYGEQ